MLYLFNLPKITDTKNIKSTFYKKSHVSSENLHLLVRITDARNDFREKMKILTKPKIISNEEKSLIEELKKYTDVSPYLV